MRLTRLRTGQDIRVLEAEADKTRPDMDETEHDLVLPRFDCYNCQEQGNKRETVCLNKKLILEQTFGHALSQSFK